MNMTFSVIIPVFNAEKYLLEALDSVRTQTFTDWECICVDDGSTDRSPAILDEYATRDKRFRIFHQPNAGEGAARNRGLREAKGIWIGWLDADDLYAPSRLEEVMRLINHESPDLVRLTSRMGRFKPKGFEEISVGNSQYTTLDSKPAVASWGWAVLLERGNVWNWYMRKELLSGLTFHEEMRIKTDSIFSVSIVPRLRKVCHEVHGSLFYRIVPTSAIHTTRHAIDTCRYLSALLEVWQSQRDYAESLGKLEYLRANLRSVAERDVIDWIYFSDHELPRERVAVKEAYDTLRSAGAFSPVWQIPSRYRLCMPLYDKFGWTLPIWLTESVCRLGGRFLRFLRSQGGDR